MLSALTAFVVATFLVFKRNLHTGFFDTNHARAKYGAFWDGLRTNRLWRLSFQVIFMGRRLLLAGSFVLVPIFSLQLGFNQFLSILHIAYVICHRPFVESRLHNLEIMNEFFLMLLTYTFPLFTCFIANGEGSNQVLAKSKTLLERYCSVDEITSNNITACQKYTFGEAHRLIFYSLCIINGLEFVGYTIVFGAIRKFK